MPDPTRGIVARAGAQHHQQRCLHGQRGQEVVIRQLGEFRYDSDGLAVAEEGERGVADDAYGAACSRWPGGR